MYEEILTLVEGIGATRHQLIFVARPDGVDATALEGLLHTVGQPAWIGGEAEAIALSRSVLLAFRSDRQGLAEDRGALVSDLQAKPVRNAWGLLTRDERPGLAQSG